MAIVSPDNRYTVKLNAIPDEIGKYHTLRVTKDNLTAKSYHTTCRYRVPHHWASISDLKTPQKVFIIVNSINSTWYHYHFSRLFPEWLFISIDLRYNGYHSVNSEHVDSLDYGKYVSDIKCCYDDIAYCYEAFSINTSATIVLYGHGYGALVALGFHKQFGAKYRITHLILNSPHLHIPSMITRASTMMIYKPLSYILPTSTLDCFVVGGYDLASVSLASLSSFGLMTLRVASLGLRFPVISSFRLAIAMSMMFFGSIMMVSRYAVGYVAKIFGSAPLMNLDASMSGNTITDQHLDALNRSYYITPNTITALPGSPTLSFWRSVVDLQTEVTSNTFVTCPTLALFSGDNVEPSLVLTKAGDTVSPRGAADECIALLNTICQVPPTALKFPNTYNDALLSPSLERVSNNIYGIINWLISHGIEFENQDRQIVDPAAITANTVYDRLDSLIVKGKDVDGDVQVPPVYVEYQEQVYAWTSLLYNDSKMQNGPPQSIWIPDINPILLPLYVNGFNQLGAVMHRPAVIPDNYYNNPNPQVVLSDIAENNIIAKRDGVYSVVMSATAQSNMDVNRANYIVSQMLHIPKMAISPSADYSTPIAKFLQHYVVKPSMVSVIPGSLNYALLSTAGESGNINTKFSIYLSDGDILTLPHFSNMPVHHSNGNTAYTVDGRAHWIKNADGEYVPETNGSGGVYYTDGNFKVTYCNVHVEYKNEQMRTP